MSDYITKAITKDGFVMAYVVNATDTLKEAFRIHNPSKTAAAALGRCLTGTLIISATLKEESHRVSAAIRSEGPIGNIITEANAKGTVKGYVSNPQVSIPLKEDGKLDVGGALGHKGILTIVKDLGLKEPYSGQVELISGEIAEDFSYYFAKSEQIPTVMGLGVLMSKENTVLSSGGFMVQLMPNAPENIISILEKNVDLKMPLSNFFYLGGTDDELLNELLNGFEYNILETNQVQYQCDCSLARVEKALLSIGEKDLLKIVTEDEQTEVTCNFCDKVYTFSAQQIKTLLKSGKEIDKNVEV